MDSKTRTPRRPTRGAGLAIALVASVVVAACGGSAATPTPAATPAATPIATAAATPAATPAATSAPTPSLAGVPDWIPAAVAQYYPGWEYFSKLQREPLASYQPPATPWTFCYNTAYLGNAFQQGVVAELEKLVQQYVAAGLATGKLEVTNSNFDPTLQLSQLNSLVQKGCKIIFGMPASPTALCSGIASANSKGSLYIAIDTTTYCDDALNVTWNGYWAEKIGAEAVFASLKGQGNVVQTMGIPGNASAVAEVYAVQDALKAYKGITILGQVNGMWTPSVAHSEMAKFLATHPQQVDGIIDAGAEGVDANLALLEAGRPAAKMNSITTECAALAFWKEHPEALALGTVQDPKAAAYEAFLVAIKMLSGQKPLVSTIFYPVPTVTSANFSDWYDPSMTIQSTCIPSSREVRAVPDSYFDVLFSGGSQPKLAPQP
jgi:ribose transport system substrate-binding protein